ncbi:MAG TPA: Uma2 family endonuclease [Kofleriaceae bacterium]|jgi:Uma2 family endonuclease
MAAIAEPHVPSPDLAVAGEHIVLHDVPWSTYVVLRDSLDEQDSRVRMTYLEGELELMSPSTLHEDAKKIIARLLELWALENRVRLNGYGSATFRAEAKKRGLEPDECYKTTVLREGDVPDLCIEVSLRRGVINKLDVYAGLGIPEVWEWRPHEAAIAVYRLAGGAYERRERSEVLPALDLAQLASFVRPDEDQLDLMTAYRAALRG